MSVTDAHLSLHFSINGTFQFYHVQWFVHFRITDAQLFVHFSITVYISIWSCSIFVHFRVTDAPTKPYTISTISKGGLGSKGVKLSASSGPSRATTKSGKSSLDARRDEGMSIAIIFQLLI